MSTEFLFLLLCDWLAKSFVILLAAFVVVRVWRSATAAQKYLIWFAALAAVLLLPATRALTPRWTILLAREADFSLPPIDSPAPASLTSEAPPAPVSMAPPAFAWTLPDWHVLALGTWLGGVTLLSGTHLLRSRRLRHLERRIRPLEDLRINLLLMRVCSQLGLKRPIKLRTSEECRVPLTWGGRRPVLLLPADALTWDDARMLTALRHELGHILHRDYLVRWLVSLTCALYWPNPFVWLAARSLRIAQEQAVDDLVLRAGTPPDEYAAQLVEAARIVGTHGFFTRQSIAMASPSTLETRVVAILDARRGRRPLSRWGLLAGAFLGALALGAAASARLQGPEQKLEEIVQKTQLRVAEEMRLTFEDLGLDDPTSRKTLSLYTEATKKKGRLLQMGLAVDAEPIQELDAQSVQYLNHLRRILAEKFPEAADGIRTEKISAEATGALVTKEWRLPPGTIPFPPEAIETGKGGPPFVQRHVLDWLTAHGIKFPTGASAIFIVNSNLLIVRNTEDQLDLVDQLVAKASEHLPPANTSEGAAAATTPVVENPLLARAAAIIIPKIELKDATVPEALDFLQKKAAEFDPQKTGIHITCPPGAAGNAKVTLSLVNIPLLEAVRYVAALANLTLRTEGNALLIGPAETPAPAQASTTTVAFTLASKKPFKDGDGIEIRNVSGSSPTFRVGGTYRVQGVCRQNTVQNASLYLGNTAEGRGDAIQPAPSTSLFKTVPKGTTEFDFTFTPLRPGKLHVTIYDLDNHDPKDNAYAGLYLGDVSP